MGLGVQKRHSTTSAREREREEAENEKKYRQKERNHRRVVWKEKTCSRS